MNVTPAVEKKTAFADLIPTRKLSLSPLPKMVEPVRSAISAKFAMSRELPFHTRA
jgi:hypothetical protein